MLQRVSSREPQLRARDLAPALRRAAVADVAASEDALTARLRLAVDAQTWHRRFPRQRSLNEGAAGHAGR